MYEDEQLFWAHACIDQWYRAHLITRHALVQPLLAQKRISVRALIRCCPRGSQRQAGVGVGVGLGTGVGKGKNAVVSDTKSFLPRGRVGKSR